MEILIKGDTRRGKEECIFAAAVLNSPLAATRYTRAILLYNETFMCIRVLWERKMHFLVIGFTIFQRCLSGIAVFTIFTTEKFQELIEN